MRAFVWSLCAVVLADAGMAATKKKKSAQTQSVVVASAPRGCFEKSWTKSELKKLPLQKVTAIRVDVNIGAQPENKPSAYGTVKAKFRDSGETWVATSFECSDTGAGFACATHCDSSIFVLAQRASGLQLMPQKNVGLFGRDCEGEALNLKMNADQVPFALSRRGNKSCPTH